MKSTILAFCLMALLASCSRKEDCHPIQFHPDYSLYGLATDSDYANIKVNGVPLGVPSNFGSSAGAGHNFFRNGISVWYERDDTMHTIDLGFIAPYELKVQMEATSFQKIHVYARKKTILLHEIRSAGAEVMWNAFPRFGSGLVPSFFNRSSASLAQPASSYFYVLGYTNIPYPVPGMILRSVKIKFRCIMPNGDVLEGTVQAKMQF